MPLSAVLRKCSAVFWCLLLSTTVAASHYESKLWSIDKPTDKISYNLLGSGGFATVYLFHRGVESFALKTTKNLTEAKMQFENELRIMKFLQENLSQTEQRNFVLPSIQFKLPFEFQRLGHPTLERGIVMEYFNNDDLWIYIDQSRFKKHSRQAKLKLALGIARALLALKNVGVIHGDIKPENIMLKRSDSGELVPALIDFGSAWIPKNGESDSGIATPFYQGPEYPRTWGSDVFSFGTTVLTLLTGDLSCDVNSDKGHRLAGVLETDPMYSVLNYCLMDRAEDRPTPEKLIEMIENIMRDMHKVVKTQSADLDKRTFEKRRYAAVGIRQDLLQDSEQNNELESVLRAARARLKRVNSKSNDQTSEIKSAIKSDDAQKEHDWTVSQKASNESSIQPENNLEGMYETGNFSSCSDREEFRCDDPTRDVGGMQETQHLASDVNTGAIKSGSQSLDLKVGSEPRDSGTKWESIGCIEDEPKTGETVEMKDEFNQAEAKRGISVEQSKGGASCLSAHFALLISLCCTWFHFLFAQSYF